MKQTEDANSFSMRCAGGGVDDVCETFRGLLIASFSSKAKAKWLHDNGKDKDYKLDDEEYDEVLEIVDEMLMSHVILVNALATPHDDSACTNE
jgi:hypothetical protein